MTKTKQNSKTKAQKQPETQTKIKQFRARYITHSKLIIVLLLLLALPLASFVYNKYKDWDNAQTIKGIAKDFPQLVEQIEQATGLNLEIKKNCMTTGEKFSSGVKTCEFRVAENADKSQINKAVEKVISSKKFSVLEHNQKSEAYRIGYRKKDSCTLSGSGTVYFSCIVGVRDSNTQLARDTF